VTQFTGGWQTGTLSSINWSHHHRALGRGGIQGDHTTAYASFKTMMENRLRGKTASEAIAELRGILAEIESLPAWQGSVPQAGEYGWRRSSALLALDNADGPTKLGEAIDKVLAVRQWVPESNKATHHPISGREAEAVRVLRGAEDALRANLAVPGFRLDTLAGGDKRSIANAMWKFLDYVPTDACDVTRNPYIPSLIFQNHIASMVMTNPLTFRHYPDLAAEMIRDLKDPGSSEHKHLLSSLGQSGRHKLFHDLDNFTAPTPAGAPTPAPVPVPLPQHVPGPGYNFRKRQVPASASPSPEKKHKGH
jgi:hypothetical protein